MAAASDIPGDSDPDQEARVRADREATDWLILLQEDDGAGMSARFDAWLRASPVNVAAWAETQHVAAAIEGTPPAHADHWVDLPGVMPVSPVVPVNRWWRGRGPAVMALAAAAACVAILATPGLMLRLQADHISGAGEMRSVLLADGSSVQLGAGSAIAVDFVGDDRHVRLLQGEAYFEVRRDPDHPFRVGAQGLETTVLGTGFEVRITETGAEVAVRHGLVRVDYPGDLPVSERLAAGDKISVAWTGNSERGRAKPDQVAAWTNGQLIVNDRAVREVIDALRPWYGGLIITIGTGLDDARVTGVYDLHDPAGALRALAKAHGADVQQVSPWIMMISPS